MVDQDKRDELLWQAIETGGVDGDTLIPDSELAKDFAAHQKLESIFAILRDPVDDLKATQDLTPPVSVGRYRIQRQLGKGAFGAVYLASDPDLDRLVAVKVPSSQQFATDEDANRFLTEARATAELKHPSIVTVHDVGCEDGQYYMVLEYVEGSTLEDVDKSEPLDHRRTAELVATIAGALQFAHEKGFIHRDLKPGNILLDKNGNPHVADFGLAVSEDSQRQLAGQVAGTPAYMSPEQLRGETHRLDGRSDIWSLGVIFYELLTGRHPFWRGQVDECLDEIQHREPKPPRQINDQIPSELEDICLKCLSKSIGDRYSSASDVAREIRDWLNEDDAGSTAPLVPAAAATRTSSRWLVPLVFAVFVLGCFLAVNYLRNGDESQSRVPSPDDIRVHGVASEVESMLRLAYSDKLKGPSPSASIRVEYQSETGAADDWRPLRNGESLSSRHSYRVLVKTDRAAHIYAIQIDSNGKVDWLFPRNATSPHSSGVNPVEAGNLLQIPQKNRAFFLDDSVGTEHLYIAVTDSRWLSLEEALEKATTATERNATINEPFALETRGVGGTRITPSTTGDETTPIIKGVEGALVEEVWFKHVAP